MTIKGRTDGELRGIIRDVVLGLWVNKALSTPEIAKVVRVDQQEAERIITEYGEAG